MPGMPLLAILYGLLTFVLVWQILALASWSILRGLSASVTARRPQFRIYAEPGSGAVPGRNAVGSAARRNHVCKIDADGRGGAYILIESAYREARIILPEQGGGRE